MGTEIEAKLKVDSLQKVRDKLTQINAEFLGQQLQIDSYFDDQNTTLTKTDRCLRLRQQLKGENERIFLTYKGAKEQSDFKKRPEIEIEVRDANSAQRLLSALGYKKILVFEKKRQTWQFNQCKISLDELPLLGNFVEIEGPDSKKIADVQKELGLADLPHIQGSYALLMEQKLCRLGREQREVFFHKS